MAAAGSHSSKHTAHPAGEQDGATVTPIKHVIVIIGENHTFDNVYATYQPPAGQHVLNLLSEGVVTASGATGPKVATAAQQQATDTTSYQVDPKDTGQYSALPQPNTTYVSQACSGQTANTSDARFPASLPNAPYQITKFVPYFDSHGQYSTAGTCEFNGAYVGDPIHRFYQMYQQVSNGANDLWTWVHQTAGDANGAAPPTPFTTNQGGLAMGFYNMASGDAPVFNSLARHNAMSDNYHQAVMGGTGANHIALGTGDAAFYQDASGNATTPPAGEIENPNPQPGTNNFYTKDGYGAKGTTNGGSYSNCSDHTAPGVKGVFDISTPFPTSCSTTATAPPIITTCSTTTTPATTSTGPSTPRPSRCHPSSHCPRSATNYPRTASAGATSARATTTARRGRTIAASATRCSTQAQS